jgi:hypothetical protein
MTLAQVQGYATALVALERERLRLAAVAARAAQTDAKGWAGWLKALER